MGARSDVQRAKDWLRENGHVRGTTYEVDVPSLAREFEAAAGEEVDERDRHHDAITAAHRALGGDGDWVLRIPAVAPPDSGNLDLDVPELAAQVRSELDDAKRRIEELEEAHAYAVVACRSLAEHGVSIVAGSEEANRSEWVNDPGFITRLSETWRVMGNALADMIDKRVPSDWMDNVMRDDSERIATAPGADGPMNHRSVVPGVTPLPLNLDVELESIKHDLLPFLARVNNALTHEFEDPENRFEQRTGRRQRLAEVLGFIAQALDDLDLVLQAAEPR